MSQTITFNCPSCSAGLTVPGNLAGVSGPCPTCGNSITAPHPQSEPEPELVPFDIPPAAPTPPAEVAENPMLPPAAAPLPSPAAPLDAPPAPSPGLPPQVEQPPTAPPAELPPVAEVLPQVSPPQEIIPPAQPLPVPDFPQPAAQAEPPAQPAVPRIEPRVLPGSEPPPPKTSGPEPFPVVAPPSADFSPPPTEALPPAQPIPVAAIPPAPTPGDLPVASIPQPAASPASIPPAAAPPAAAPTSDEGLPPLPPELVAPPIAGSASIPEAPTNRPPSRAPRPGEEIAGAGFPAAAAMAPVAPLEFKKRKRSKFPLGAAAALMVVAAGAAAWFVPASKEFILAKAESIRSLVEKDDAQQAAPPELSATSDPTPAKPSPSVSKSAPEKSEPAPELTPEPPAPEPDPIGETPVPEAIPADVSDASAAVAPTNRPTPPKANPSSLHDIVYEFDEENSLLKAPREALASFLGAPNWQERAKYVQSTDRVTPLMEKYYQDKADGPIHATTVTFQNSERVPGNDSMLFLFHITTDKVPEGFPVSVEETKNGMRVDWEPFVEFNDKLLFGFLNNYQEEPAQFHVIMRRAHYFGPGVPDLEGKYAFRIEPPIPGYQGYAFVERDDPIVQSKLSYQLEWHAISYPIVELQWKRNKDTRQQFVTIKDIVQNSWRSEKKTESSVVADQ